MVKNLVRIFRNKKNGQLMVMLPKSKLDFLKKKNPRFLNIGKIKEKDFED